MDQEDIAKLLRRGWWASRGILLFLLPLPLLIAVLVSLFRGDVDKLLFDACALTLFLTGATLTRKGFAKQAELEEKGLSVPTHTFPYKTLGASCVSLGTFVTSFLSVDHDLLFSISVASLTFLGFYLCYGLSPKSTVVKTDFNQSDASQEEWLQALSEATAKIDAIELASKNLTNEELTQRIKRIIALARQVMRTIEQSPKDLLRARKFLYVYLDGAKSVCEGYAKAHHKTAGTRQLESNFRNVLITIEDVFQQQQQRLLEKEITDLDIQIEVLNKQLKREGLY